MHVIDVPIDYSDNERVLNRELDWLLEQGADYFFVWGGDGMAQRCIDSLAGSGATVAIVYDGAYERVAEQIGARSALALCGVGLAIAGVAALAAKRQLASLAVERDGVTLRGDLRGTGAEHSELGARVLDSQRP